MGLSSVVGYNYSQNEHSSNPPRKSEQQQPKDQTISKLLDCNLEQSSRMLTDMAPNNVNFTMSGIKSKSTRQAKEIENIIHTGKKSPIKTH